MPLYTFNDGTVIPLKYVVAIEPLEPDEEKEGMMFVVRMIDGTWIVCGNPVLETEVTERESLINALTKFYS